ncbi:MAG: AAA family ATPase, partial [Bacillota bacterium]|nr:AAA family ATPase [Bacillota bacterium]
MAKVIVIANQKGGVGKTTTAVNLSAYLGQHRKKTLLIDTDPQGNASAGVGIDRDALENCLYDALINDVPLKALIKATDFKNLHIVPSSRQLGGAEIELVDEVEREKRLSRQVAPVAEEYDFIIIDAPPALGLLTLNALNAADSLIVPLQCEYYALEGLRDITNTFQLVKTHMNPKLTLEGILLTMYD